MTAVWCSAHRPGPMALLIAGLAAVAGGTGAAAAPADPGFRLVVAGSAAGMAGEAFHQAVAEALPAALTSPASNFTQDSSYLPGHVYDVVLVFHGDDKLDPLDLCGRAPAEPAAAPFGDLMATVHLSGALCRDDQPVTAATARMTGSIVPGDAGFRFLVGDVAKQLFPDGFATLPRKTAVVRPVAPP